jgi:hypothetical protein
MGEEQKLNEDRCYTRKEILRLFNVCDLRMKMIVPLMATSGMKIGTLPGPVLFQPLRSRTRSFVNAGNISAYLSFGRKLVRYYHLLYVLNSSTFFRLTFTNPNTI